VPEVVVKDGTRPTWLSVEEESFHRAVVPAECTVDTTGAGDSFNGAYLAARIRGFSLGAAVAMGQAVAACVVGRRGALVPAPDLQAASKQA
jgi:2-dehydro-3-deoxygluconokinase